MPRKASARQLAGVVSRRGGGRRRPSGGFRAGWLIGRRRTPAGCCSVPGWSGSWMRKSAPNFHAITQEFSRGEQPAILAVPFRTDRAAAALRPITPPMGVGVAAGCCSYRCQVLQKQWIGEGRPASSASARRPASGTSPRLKEYGRCAWQERRAGWHGCAAVVDLHLLMLRHRKDRDRPGTRVPVTASAPRSTSGDPGTPAAHAGGGDLRDAAPARRYDSCRPPLQVSAAAADGAAALQRGRRAPRKNDPGDVVPTSSRRWRPAGRRAPLHSRNHCWSAWRRRRSTRFRREPRWASPSKISRRDTGAGPWFSARTGTVKISAPG